TPPRQPTWKYQTTSPHPASACLPTPPTHRRLIADHTRMARPLRSARITRPHRYYETVRPAPRIGTLPLAVPAAWVLPVAATTLVHRPLLHARVAHHPCISR